MNSPRWLETLNAGDQPAPLIAQLRACCTADSWIAALLAARPFADADALFAASDRAIAVLDDAGLAQALAAHPRIGERAGEHSTGTESEATWSRQEQSGVVGADDSMRAQLAEANQRYEARFGRVYLVCASGRSAEELLATGLARLDNDDATERAVVLGELAQISRLRLSRLLTEEAQA